LAITYAWDGGTGTVSQRKLEFYVILSGEIFCEVDDEKVVLGSQDYFTAKGLMEPLHFKSMVNTHYDKKAFEELLKEEGRI
jgi:hypothetical protein